MVKLEKQGKIEIMLSAEVKYAFSLVLFCGQMKPKL